MDTPEVRPSDAQLDGLRTSIFHDLESRLESVFPASREDWLRLYRVKNWYGVQAPVLRGGDHIFATSAMVAW